MSNVVKMKTRELSNIAGKINSLYREMNTAYLETAALFSQALDDQFSGDKTEFMQWAQEVTPYSSGHINRFLKIQNRFGSHSAVQQSENPIPFNVLSTLAGNNIPGDVVKRVTRMYQRKGEVPTEREAIEVIRDSVPSKPKLEPPYNKPMSQRIPKEGYVARAEYLLDVNDQTSSETIRILTKHWKNKYHPDKGGDARVFNLIVQAEKVLLKKRGEK